MPDPYPYQIAGATALTRHRNFILADEMGLGKTCQAIIACDRILADRVMCIVPAALRENWRREFATWSVRNLDIRIIRSVKDAEAWAEAGAAGDVIIISYDLAASKHGYPVLTSAGRFDVLICDEAHYLKSAASRRTRTVLGTHNIKGSFREISDRAWMLTGTPMPNNPLELYPILKAFGLWRDSKIQFLDTFCIHYTGNYGVKVTGTRNKGVLRALLKTCMLRRMKADVLPDLPSIRYTTVTVDSGFDSEDMIFPDVELARDAAKAVIKAIEAGDPPPVGAHIASTRRLIGLAKVGPVVKMLETEFNGGLQKIVLFCHHRDVIKLLADRLVNYGPVTFFGDTYAHAKQGIVDVFQNDPSCRVFIGQNTAAGVGITLTAAHDILHVEPDWVPANLAQATMRVHRIGQTERVLARMAVLKGSIDELITEALLTKTRMIRDILN